MPETTTIKCGLCHYEFENGAQVCQGCQGTVVYGATSEEVAEAAKIGALMWGGGSLFLIFALPQILNSQFSWTLTHGWGVGIWGLVIAAVSAAWGTHSGATKAKLSKRGMVRTFRRL